LGDEDYVVVVDRKASDPLIQDNEVVVYRTMDGTEVSRFRLPEHGSCWSAAGRNLLLWRDTPTGGTELRLWDAVRNAEIWSESFQDGAKGTIVAGEEVLVCQKDGRLVIRSLFDDAHRLETNVEPEAKLTGVYAMRSHEAYYFTVARAVAGAAARPMARSWPIVCGSLYRLNRQTQELDWPSPATIDGAILMLELPTNSPSIVFFGNDGIGAQATTMRTNTQSVMCVDKQTGRAIFSRRQIPQATASRGPQLAVDPQNKTLQLAIGSQSFEMTFTSEPRPPEPPVQDWSVSNRTR